MRGERERFDVAHVECCSLLHALRVSTFPVPEAMAARQAMGMRASWGADGQSPYSLRGGQSL